MSFATLGPWKFERKYSHLDTSDRPTHGCIYSLVWGTRASSSRVVASTVDDRSCPAVFDPVTFFMNLQGSLHGVFLALPWELPWASIAFHGAVIDPHVNVVTVRWQCRSLLAMPYVFRTALRWGDRSTFYPYSSVGTTLTFDVAENTGSNLTPIFSLIEVLRP